MRRGIILSLLLLMMIPTTVTAVGYMLMPIDSVYDGDTIKTHFSTWKMPAPLDRVSIRILGIDTPERPAKSYATTGKLGRAACIKEAEWALRATQAVKDLAFGHARMKVSNFKYGKFGGRILGDVKIGGVDVATMLIAKNLAVPYFGGKKTKDWCK